MAKAHTGLDRKQHDKGGGGHNQQDFTIPLACDRHHVDEPKDAHADKNQNGGQRRHGTWSNPFRDGDQHHGDEDGGEAGKLRTAVCFDVTLPRCAAGWSSRQRRRRRRR